ncbi:MAG TPA: mandelate racemase/muconate lactonizing enzyme family protein [Bryobacteraceae bacterium]|nr:mandelate racemase/muconate lactonizing enzyme family protein [Bryobacteraceae bacterium]
MKITAVDLYVLKSPGLYNNPAGSEEPLGPTYMGIVKVSTDAGLCGYSDMETCASVAKACVDAPRWSQEDGMECFDGLASLLVGQNPLEVERLWYRMYRGSIYYGRRGVAIQAISAIDIALWDICGKAYNQPIHILLGGKYRDRVRTYASTLFRPDPQAMREAVKGYLGEGFTAVKFGWGVFGKDRRHDIRLVEAAREALGDANDLLVDTGWFVERTAKEAIQVVKSIEPFQPFLVEELLHPEDYDGYRQVAQAVDTRIACGEQEATEWGFQQLIERGGLDVLQPDLTRCGGFTVARKIVHMAERANRLVIPHSWSSDLLTAASLHLTAFLRRAEFVEFSTSQGPLSRMLVKEPLRMQDGFLRVPSGPGLGVEVNDAIIEQYRVA